MLPLRVLYRHIVVKWHYIIQFCDLRPHATKYLVCFSLDIHIYAGETAFIQVSHRKCSIVPSIPASIDKLLTNSFSERLVVEYNFKRYLLPKMFISSQFLTKSLRPKLPTIAHVAI